MVSSLRTPPFCRALPPPTSPLAVQTQISFLEQEWPKVPILYRTPTYPYKVGIGSTMQINGNASTTDFTTESIYRIQQSAFALAATQPFPLFRWGEKLMGHHEYSEYP